ncbi:Aste57867_18746 [Aphanomyces stellatus]|uniref:Aste57867_18746 protein n=1 Tax=Aphanomyces stellatus TaxID=120398 RepID=A0A485LCK8_9STRA|nr:hypothetical protein As57867_018682 [Aphanomyces stellatus]VFT95480.1 Aste57867_18746 [Aphanomyces stellatus]
MSHAVVTGNNNDDDASSRRYHASKYDIWALGITVVIGGQYISWNAGLAAGVMANAIALGLTGTGYLCLTLSLAETVSALPFAGGAYGLSRVSMGYFCGFLVGCCETLQYIIYTSSSVLVLTDMLVVCLFPGITYFAIKPLLWILIYATILALHLRGHHLFWRTNALLAAVSLAVLVVYIGGSLPTVHFSQYAGGPAWQFRGGGAAFLRHLPLTAWFFVGIESLNTVSNMVARPKHIIPFGQVACMLTLLVTSASVFFVAVSLPPGVASLATDLVVLNAGFTTMLSIPAAAATALSIPATFATIYGFVFSYSSILASMAASKLLPSHLAFHHPTYQSHPVAAAAGSALGLVFCAVTTAASPNIQLYNVCMTFGFLANVAQCWNFLYFSIRFKHVPRTFHSPLGVGGAVVAIAVSLVQLVALLGFQE